MATSRHRLSDGQLAAVARYSFGLTDAPPDLPCADEFEDAEGALVATGGGDGLSVVTIPRWRAPDAVSADLRRRGWAEPVAWIGWPPEHHDGLPSQLLALLPAAGLGPDHAALSTAAAAWAPVRGAGTDVVVVPVPISPAGPELPWTDLAVRFGARLLGSRLEPALLRTGGTVVMFTGLSGAGKSTIAGRLVELLIEGGRTVTLLDGDDVRSHLSAGLGFSRQDRDLNVARIGWVAARIAKHGGTAVCAPIAPYAAVREDVRREVEAQAGGGSFVLVHVATSLEDCEQRDRKGLYAKARRGEIPAFTGISDPYEAPTDAEVTLDTHGRTVDDCARQVLDHLLAS